MAQYCNWCKGEVKESWKLCSGCQLLSPEFFGTDIRPFLSNERNAETNRILSSARGLSNHQRIKHLTQEVELDIPIPPILRSKRKGGINSLNYDPKEWRKILQHWDRFGQIRIGNYFFPDGSLLSIREKNIYYIDEHLLDGNVPFLDLAEWLANPLRSDSIRYWDEFILLLDCTLTKIPIIFSNEEDWANWIKDNTWKGIDYPVKSFYGPAHVSSRMPPFLTYIYRKYRLDDYKTAAPEIIRENLDALKSKEYGVIGENWVDVYEQNNFREEYLKQTIPVLIVSNYRLKLFAIKDSKPATYSIGNDPRDWRKLLTWALQPYGNRGSELIQGLVMNWAEEEAIWIPSKRQIISARLFHDEIIKLGEYSSLVPLEYDRATPGLFVKGISGVHYVISSTSHMKIKVDVVPGAFDVNRASEVGIDLCIDPIVMDDIPFGDVAVSYLLALHNDEDSRRYIFTLDLFLTALEKTDSKLDDEIYWETVESSYEKLLEEIQTPFPFADDGEMEAEIEQYEREQLAISLNEEYEYEQEIQRRMDEEREKLEEQLQADFEDFCRNMALQGDDDHYE